MKERELERNRARRGMTERESGRESETESFGNGVQKEKGADTERGVEQKNGLEG